MKTKLLTLLMLTAIFSMACMVFTAPASKQVLPKRPVYATHTPSAATITPQSNIIEITISSFKFDPESVTVAIGTTITWTNQDSSNHTVVADDGSWMSDSLAKGTSFSFTFDKAGTYTYICSVHPAMKGTILVK